MRFIKYGFVQCIFVTWEWTQFRGDGPQFIALTMSQLRRNIHMIENLFKSLINKTLLCFFHIFFRFRFNSISDSINSVEFYIWTIRRVLLLFRAKWIMNFRGDPFVTQYQSHMIFICIRNGYKIQYIRCTLCIYILYTFQSPHVKMITPAVVNSLLIPIEFYGYCVNRNGQQWTYFVLSQSRYPTRSRMCSTDTRVIKTIEDGCFFP